MAKVRVSYVERPSPGNLNIVLQFVENSGEEIRISPFRHYFFAAA